MRRLREWWATRRGGPLTLDNCAVCNKRIRRKELVEVVIGDPEFSSEFGGFSAVLVTYCKNDDPRKAKV